MSCCKLTDFQVEKLEYYFRFLCPNDKDELDAGSLERFMTKVLDFTGWDDEGKNFKECKEVHEAFYETLFQRAKIEAERNDIVYEGEDKCSKDAWLNLWSYVLYGVRGMSQFPVWLRIIQKNLFKMIDRHHKDEIQENDLRVFYKDMIHLTDEQVEKIAKLAFNQMTDEGRYKLDMEGYEQIFANFLIGRTPHGPGRFIFGCFEHEVKPFCLIQPMADPTDEKFVAKKVSGRRPSRV